MIPISVLVFGLLLNSFASCDITLSTSPPPEESCETTLALCKLDVKKLNAVIEPGAIGPRGPKGEVGDPGDVGSDGVNGFDGPDGAPGRKGEVGEDGSGAFGKAVAKGQKGDRGPKGSPGKSGGVGEQGREGLKGLRGDQGVPGFIGSFFSKPELGIPTDGGIEWGSMSDPATVTCKDAPESERTKHTETYYVYIGDMTVKCDFQTNMTCVLKENDELIDIPYNESKPFWLSQKITFEKIYGIEYDQLSWLQQESYKANLTIRFNCFNSKPVGNDSMNLLTWNDLTIGPEPTNATLFHYTVLNDGCSNALKDEWSSTDIMLVSPIAQRLPIIDFLIKDVGRDNQVLRIEILQMCFG